MTSSSARASVIRIQQLIIKELRQLFRDPKTKRIMFVSPVIQLLLFGYAVNTDVRDTALFVVDHDRTAEARALVDALTAGGYFRVAGRSDDASELARALDRGEAVVGLEVPPGFGRDFAAGRTAHVQVLIDGTNSNTATVAQGYALRIIQRFASEHAAQLGAAAGQPSAAGAEPGGADLRARAWYNPDLASRVYNIPAVIGAILLLMCLLLTALAVVREREIGTLEQLVVSPLTPGELMLGKTLPVALVALVDLALVTGVAILWFGIPLRGSVFALLLASIVFILAGLALGLLISTVSSTQQEAFMSMFLFFLPVIILSGFLYPIETMPPFFQYLTLLNPLRYFLEIVRAIFLKGHGVADLWPQYLVLAVFAAAVLRLAVWRFRATLA